MKPVKKKLKRGRPTKTDLIAKATIDQQEVLEEAVAEDVMDAYNVLKENMLDKSAPATVRNSAAKEIIVMHSKFYKMRVREELEDDEDAIEEEEETAVVFKFNAS